MAKVYRLNNINWTNTLFLTLSPIIAVIGTITWLKVDGFSWGIIGLAVAFYICAGLGITVGYHRLFSHRAFKAHPVIKALFLLFGGCALQNSALKWCNDHRVHHTKVDSPEDPYNIEEGFFYAHMGWIFLKDKVEDYKYSKDLLNDKMVMLQDKYYLPMIITFSFILPALLGYFLFDSLLGGFFVAGFARIVFLHHCTFFINSLCHVLGSRPYDTTQSARDSWVTALFTFGEGYHNFHHTFQADYRNGIRWYHYDPSKWLIKTFSFLGLAWDLKKVDESQIILKMIQANLAKASKKNRLEELRESIKDKSRVLVARIRESKERMDQNEALEQLRLLLKQSQALV